MVPSAVVCLGRHYSSGLASFLSVCLPFGNKSGHLFSRIICFPIDRTHCMSAEFSRCAQTSRPGSFPVGRSCQCHQCSDTAKPLWTKASVLSKSPGPVVATHTTMSATPSTQAGLLAVLRDLQHQPPFADVTIQLKEGPVRTSRIMLAAMSSVFKKMALETPAQDLRTLQIPHLSQAAWQCVCDFYLSGEASLSLETVADVLEVSNWYQLDELKEHCGKFLTSCCTFKNCLTVRSIAKQFCLAKTAEKALQVFTSHLQAGCSPEAFLCLEKTEPLELLEKEELAATEDDVCEALLAWMETKEANDDSCNEVFQHVSLRNVSEDSLVKHVMCHSVCGRTPALQSKVQDEVLRRLQRHTPLQVQAVSRTSRAANGDRSLLVVGRNSLWPGSISTYVWRFQDKKWISFPTPEQKGDISFAAAIIGDTVFITGGWNNAETLHFDLKSRTWTTKSRLTQERRYQAMAVVRDKVYVVGGHGSAESQSVEEYCKTRDTWTHTGDLQFDTYSCGVAVLGDIILVVGGNTDESQSLIQTFNVETKTAAVLDTQLPCPMRHVRAAVLGNTAFFVGWDGNLVQIREMEGTFQMVSHVVLEGFQTGSLYYGVHVEAGCVRVIGGKGSKSVLCWTWQGQKIENDDMADLPECLSVFAMGEVNVST